MDAAAGFIAPTTARTPRFFDLTDANAADTLAAISAGLLAAPAQVAPKYFYDALGSRLFDAITELDEYTATRDEAALFDAHAEAIAARCGHVGAFIDLGAGNCAKALRWLARLAPQQYVAVDISTAFLRDALAVVQRRFPVLDVVGVGSDFSSTLQLPAEARGDARLFFYPGSSIGNFSPPEARAFLRRIRAACAPSGALLIGVDRVKSKAQLEAAYDDALGVTAAFNLNLLRHLNRIIGSDFDVRQWQHVALFNDEHSRIEMHLQARQALTVGWRGGLRRFAAGERLHTENSYKYSAEAFAALLRDAGFADLAHWSDAQGRFSVFHARA